MVEKILGKRQAEDIYFSAFLSGLLAEKQASIISTEMKKKAAGDKFSWMKLLKGLGGAIGTAGGAAKGARTAICFIWTICAETTAGTSAAMRTPSAIRCAC